MYDFAYHKPSSLAEAVKLLADPEAKALSGGQTLLPALKHRLNRPSSLVDLTGIAEMKGIRREGDTLVVGALSRHADIQDSDVVRQAIPALARMAGHLGDTQVRNRGTIGGSLANNDPAADYPAAALAPGARFGTGRRRWRRPWPRAGVRKRWRGFASRRTTCSATSTAERSTGRISSR